MDAAGRGRLRRPSTELPQPPQRVADPAVEKDLRSRLQATPGSAPAARTKPLGWRGPSHGGLTAVSPVNYAEKKLSLVQPIVQRPVRRLSTDYFAGSGVVAAAGGVAAAAGGGSQAVAALRRADSATFGDGTQQQQQQQQQQSVPSAFRRRSSKSKVYVLSMIASHVAAALASCICTACARSSIVDGIAKADKRCCDDYASIRTSWCLEEGLLGSSGGIRGGVTLSKALTCTCT
jgi:hypothetical protein